VYGAATSSLPVPVSPVIRTVESVGATLDTRESTACSAVEVPTISSNIDSMSISSRRAMFSMLEPLFSRVLLLGIGKSAVTTLLRVRTYWH